MTKETLNLLEFLQQFRRGALLSAADKQLDELVQAIAETGGNGELVIKLPLKMNNAGQVECSPTVTVKAPKPPLGTGFFFIDQTHQKLTRRDPTQMDIEDEIDKRRTVAGTAS
jgi:hypothetical protein